MKQYFSLKWLYNARSVCGLWIHCSEADRVVRYVCATAHLASMHVRYIQCWPTGLARVARIRL